MNKINTSIILAITIIFALAYTLVASPSPVSANSKYSHDNWTDTLTGFPVVNECTGELIMCEGIMRGSNQRVTDRSGGVHCVIQFHFNLSGTGSYGNEYQVIGNFKQHFNTRSNGLAYECTRIEKANLISHGKDTNMKLYIKNHVTVNANGEISVSFSDAWIDDCQNH